MELLKKKWVKITLTVAACICAVYLMVYVDVILRARSAYLEGEKYWAWNENPKLKADALEKEFQKDKLSLDKKLEKLKITQDEYNKQYEIMKFRRDERISESSIKYAYIWYQTTVELFSPPESKWVKQAREKMPKAKDLWKKELKDKKIPFEDYMLE
ncbi:MAG: hypothetical protein ABII64_06345 [Elusimicrobiota bacterium]